jgi:AAA domain-containing protein
MTPEQKNQLRKDVLLILANALEHAVKTLQSPLTTNDGLKYVLTPAEEARIAARIQFIRQGSKPSKTELDSAYKDGYQTTIGQPNTSLLQMSGDLIFFADYHGMLAQSKVLDTLQKCWCELDFIGVEKFRTENAWQYDNSEKKIWKLYNAHRHSKNPVVYADNDECTPIVPADTPEFAEIRKFATSILNDDENWLDSSGLLDLTVEHFPNADFEDVERICYEVQWESDHTNAEKEKKPKAEIPQPKFGDFKGPCIDIVINKRAHRVDQYGQDIYTGEIFSLMPDTKVKLALLLEEQKNNEFREKVKKARFDPNGAPQKREYDYEDLVVKHAFCLWLGDRKAEKSLFALRKAMHDACGKNWLNYKNARGPLRVLYFDTENDSADVHERFHEIIQEFSADEQKLIKQNLQIEVGRELKKNRVDFDVRDRSFWKWLKNRHAFSSIVYLDCWYQLQDIKPSDNEAQKKALEQIQLDFPDATIFLLHHTGRESQENLAKKSPPTLRSMGAERWSNKSAGGNVLTKFMDLIICQCPFEVRDPSDETAVKERYIDLQAYSRSGLGTSLMSFEPVFGEEIAGVVHEYKFRRKLVRILSGQAARALKALMLAKGPWKSKYEMSKAIGVGGVQYITLEELLRKQYIIRDGDILRLNEQGEESLADAVENARKAQDERNGKTPGKLLDELLLDAEGAARPEGMPLEVIKAKAELEGIKMAAIRQMKTRRHIRSEMKDGKDTWFAPV